ncbi:MAG: bifunctional UDP-sugar hydrolase/5'-nucleotidase [Candidatus Methylacidiphilales bacterium]
MNAIARAWSRRRFLAWTGAAAAALALPRHLRSAPQPKIISIFHTTDLHGNILPTSNYEGVPDLGGLARCAHQIKLWRRENPDSLTLDIGDVYQGTPAGLATEGRMMMDCFNALNYDAWVVGNHEFDWGMDPFLRALSASRIPSLFANANLHGHRAGAYPDANHPFAKIAPLLLKDVGGIKIAVIGVCTPGLPFWFHPSFFDGIEPLDPIEPVRAAIQQAREAGANAILLAGHMGLRDRGDDFANRVQSLTAEFPEVRAFLAGHTHRENENVPVNGIPYTQASYFGIHCGRLDLAFDPDTGAFLSATPKLVLMDKHVPLDPATVDLCRAHLDDAERAQAVPVVTFTRPISTQAPRGQLSPLGQLIAEAITEALRAKNVLVDGVFHGLFVDDPEIPAGVKTVADMWKIIPFENFVITGQMTPSQILTVMTENFETAGRRPGRTLSGFQLKFGSGKKNNEITAVLNATGQPLDARKRYIIAMNTFDAQSGGHRLLKLRAIMQEPETAATLHPVQTRTALIDYLSQKQTI